MEEPVDAELMLNRFNRLVKELLQGEVRRTCFHPWEVEMLIDLQDCRLAPSRREEALRRYQRAVQRQLERGEIPPVKLSEFLARRAQKVELPAAPALAAAPVDADIVESRS
jgi:hypothetical protein